MASPKKSKLFNSVKAVAAISAALLLSSCSANPGADNPGNETVTLKLIAHDSFQAFVQESPESLEAFTTQTGIEIELVGAEDAGALVNQLVLSKSAPLADVVFGIDNNFAGRAIKNDILLPYQSKESVNLPERFYLPEGSGKEFLTPITNGDVCLNIDSSWFEKNKLAAPSKLSDLVLAEYKDLTAIPAATTSSPGFAFLLATIAEFGETEWQNYWTKLLDNGAVLVPGWTEAYYTEFTISGGSKPIVVSYSSSPAFAPETASLNSSCYQQIEYAGVLAGTKNQQAAEQLVDFLAAKEFQDQVAGMYVFPTNTLAAVPENWEQNVSIPESSYVLDPKLVDEKRENWLNDWSTIISR